MNKGTGTKRLQGWHSYRYSVGGGCPPLEENVDLPDFTPERVHLLLQDVYGDFPHHNDGSHQDGGVANNAIWKSRWYRLAAQLASLCATPPGAVGRWFTDILATE